MLFARIARRSRSALWKSLSALRLTDRVYRFDDSTTVESSEQAGVLVASEERAPTFPLPPDPSGLARLAETPPAIDFPPLKIVEIPEGRVRTEGGIISTDHTVVLWLTHGIPPRESLRQFRERFSPRVLSRKQVVPGTSICFAHTNPSTYYHFLLDLSTQLQVCHRLRRTPDSVVLFADPTAQERDVLRCYGLEDERIFVANPSPNVQCERLWLVSPINVKLHPSDNLWFYRPDVIADHADRIMDGVGVRPQGLSSGSRLYVTREGRYRGLTNEQELRAVLEDAGFEAIDPQALSLRDQVEAFASAEVVLGVHGSGLANMVFGQPGCQVAEILTPDWISPCYAHLAELRDLSYQCFLGGHLAGEAFPAPVDEVARWLASL